MKQVKLSYLEASSGLGFSKIEMSKNVTFRKTKAQKKIKMTKDIFVSSLKNKVWGYKDLSRTNFWVLHNKIRIL